MEVITRILRHLPIFTPKGARAEGGGQAAGQEMGQWVSSVYLDSPSFDSYSSRLSLVDGAQLVRIRFYGLSPEAADVAYIERCAPRACRRDGPLMPRPTADADGRAFFLLPRASMYFHGHPCTFMGMYFHGHALSRACAFPGMHAGGTTSMGMRARGMRSRAAPAAHARAHEEILFVHARTLPPSPAQQDTPRQVDGQSVRQGTDADCARSHGRLSKGRAAQV